MSANSKLPLHPTIRNWLADATTRLSDSDIDSARLDSELLLAHCLGVNRAWLHAHDADELPPRITIQADALLDRRYAREPVAYIIGYKEFYGREFIVTPDVLIPRPESETIVKLAKQYNLSGRLLDVGCGSGALGLTLALELPLRPTLSDISLAALDIARKNAQRLGAPPVRLVVSDLLEHWLSHDKPQPFDVIVANLPYVDVGWERSPETDHEPALALFAEDGGLALISQLIIQAPTLLASGSYLLLEADPEQHERIIEHATKSGLVYETAQHYVVMLRKP